MAIKQMIIEYLRAYQVTGNVKFLLRARALQMKLAFNN